jgi:hypothetical protein
MATPIKPNIGSKTDFAPRPSVPASQKENATEFNLLVSAIRANYERLILNWLTDVAANATLDAGQYVLFSGLFYRIHTSYNVGNPITWDDTKATLISGGVDHFRGDYDASSNLYPATGGAGAAGAILAGDTFRVSVGGNLDIFGLGTTAVEVGAMLTAWVDTPGQTAANWKVVQ